MDYDLVVDLPIGFYDEAHRSAHFLTFAESGGMQGGQSARADMGALIFLLLRRMML